MLEILEYLQKNGGEIISLLAVIVIAYLGKARLQKQGDKVEGLSDAFSILKDTNIALKERILILESKVVSLEKNNSYLEFELDRKTKDLVFLEQENITLLRQLNKNV